MRRCCADRPCFTLHVYAPPYTRATRYCERTGCAEAVDITLEGAGAAVAAPEEATPDALLTRHAPAESAYASHWLP